MKGTASLATASKPGRAVPGIRRIQTGHFQALAAGGGDDDAVSALLATDYNRRLAMLRMVLDLGREAEQEGGWPLPPLDEAWTLLDRAQRHAPDGVARLLRYPPVGLWAAQVLRRLHASAPGSSPLWVEVGHLHAVATAAGVLAGEEFVLRIPCRDGAVCLPMLGQALIPAGACWTTASVRGDAGRVTFTNANRTVGLDRDIILGRDVGAPDAGWRAVRTLRAGSPTAPLAVTLDDVDPFRALHGPTPSDRLTAHAVAEWQQLLDEAWGVLADTEPDHVPALRRGLSTLVPLRRTTGRLTASVSYADALGCVSLAEPDDPVQFAATLTHEFQHTKLSGLMHMVKLYTGEARRLYYSPWRDDPRPLVGLLQGVYAFFGVTRFWRAYRRTAGGRRQAAAHFAFALCREQTLHAARSLRDSPDLTDDGRFVVDRLLRRMRPWQDDPVPSDLLSDARMAVADHEAGWRIRHLRPPAPRVADLVRAWRRRRPAPQGRGPCPLLSPDPAASGLDTRAALIRMRIQNPDGLGVLTRSTMETGRIPGGLTAADVAFARGEAAVAHSMYLCRISQDPSDLDAWTGLRLTWPQSAVPGTTDPALRVLSEDPGLAVAVAVGLRNAVGRVPPPIEITRWLGGGPHPEG